MKVVILGAGRIGRGFVTQIMKLNQNEITYFDASADMVKALKEAGSYTIHVFGHPEKDMRNENAVIYSTDDLDQLAASWAEADFIFTACGGKNMPSVGATIGKAFRRLEAINGVHTSNIVTCENWVDPAKDLHAAILNELNDKEKALFEAKVGVSEAVILTTGAGAPSDYKLENPMDTWIQDFRYLPIDAAPIKGEKPKWKYVDWIEKFGDLLTQKLYTNNTSCASVAYLGRLKGIKLLGDAANDPEIYPILEEVYREINDALINGLGIDAESQYAFSKRAMAKYTDRNIIDNVTRIARDPLRKLRPNDRLIGPAHIALKAGRKPKAIALATAAALYYENPEDESAVKLAEMRREHGVEYIMQNVCGLRPDEELYGMILDSIQQLKDKGWIKE